MKQRVKAVYKIAGITLSVLMIPAVLLVLSAIGRRERSIVDDFNENPESFSKIAEVLYETVDHPRCVHAGSIENENLSIQAELRRMFSKYRVDCIEIDDRAVYFKRFSSVYDLIYSPDFDYVKERTGGYCYTGVANWYGYFLNPV